MKGLLLTLLLMQNPATPQSAPAPLRLKETIKDFPRSQFQPAATEPISIELNQTTRDLYETLAGRAGLNIVFDPEFRSAFTSFRIEKADIVDALDRLSSQTGNFVEVLDNKTIIVAPNNAAKRREFETQVLKTFYLANSKTPQQMSGIVTTLRTALQLRFIAISTSRNAIMIKDTPDKIASAEKVIAELDGSQPGAFPPQAIAVDAAGNILTLDASGFRKSALSRSQLQLKTSAAVTINMNHDSRASYEALADMAGLNIVFDRDFRRAGVVPLKLLNVGILDALDILALQTQSLWEVLDGKTILVMPRNQTKRRDYAHTFVRTFHLANVATQTEITELITALRTLLNLRYVAQVMSTNAIAIRDTQSQLALAEKLIADLDRPIGSQTVPPAHVPLEAGSETGGVLKSRAFRKLAAARPQLQLKVTGPLTLDMTGDIRKSYEQLAGLAGIHVTFDSRFQNVPMERLTLKDVDVIDALDFLSLESRTFWQVLDDATILVAPDNQTARRALEPRITETIHLTNIRTPEGVREVVAALRTLFNASLVEGSANAIVMTDTVENIALAEKFIANLNRP